MKQKKKKLTEKCKFYEKKKEVFVCREREGGGSEKLEIRW